MKYTKIEINMPLPLMNQRILCHQFCFEKLFKSIKKWLFDVIPKLGTTTYKCHHIKLLIDFLLLLCPDFLSQI